MKAQEPQLLDKMENVAYRLAQQADDRKKHMNSRCCPTPSTMTGLLQRRLYLVLQHKNLHFAQSQSLAGITLYVS